MLIKNDMDKIYKRIKSFMEELDNPNTNEGVNLFKFCNYMNDHKWYLSVHQDIATKLFHLMFDKITYTHLLQLSNVCDIYEMFTVDSRFTVTFV